MFCLMAVLLLCDLPCYHEKALGSVAVVTPQNERVSSESPTATLQPDYSSRQWSIEIVMAPKAWQVTAGKPDVIIAVLDTGIDIGHEDLVGKVIAEVNFTDSLTAEDRYGHGTHVAGIIAAAARNGVGIAGLAYDCQLLNVKVADDRGRFDASVAAKGVVWAVERGAKVINMSLVSTQPSQELEKAIDYAWSKGAIVVAAAGNFTGTKPVYPAYYNHCLAVAATDSHDCVPLWSGSGDWVDVAAPGADIYSTLPGNQYGNKSGTSMATAHVSGLAGLLFTVAKDTNGDGAINDEVRNAIENSCDMLGAGYVKGRINAFRAVNSVLGVK